MSATFKPGDVCIWQNCVGPYAYLNGSETTITGGAQLGYDHLTFTAGFGYPTDTRDPIFPEYFLLGAPHELRRKNPPTTGEDSILALFVDQPQAVPA